MMNNLKANFKPGMVAHSVILALRAEAGGSGNQPGLQ
jgi:hypothetical protein